MAVIDDGCAQGMILWPVGSRMGVVESRVPGPSRPWGCSGRGFAIGYGLWLARKLEPGHRG